MVLATVVRPAVRWLVGNRLGALMSSFHSLEARKKISGRGVAPAISGRRFLRPPIRSYTLAPSRGPFLQQLSPK